MDESFNPTPSSSSVILSPSITQSPSPSMRRNRSAWFLTISKCSDINEVTINYKNTKGQAAPYSRSKTSSIVKIPWGTPIKCEYIITKKEGETFGEFKFTNKRRETEMWREDALNSFEWDVNSFSRKIASMIVEKKQKLLAIFLTLLPHSLGFVHHRPGLHSEEGFITGDLDESHSSDHIVKNGGTLADYLEFIKLANESAKPVENKSGASGDISQFFVKKSKPAATGTKSKKSKLEIIDDSENSELRDPGGIEQEYKNSIEGMANIPLVNISIPEELGVKVNPFKVYKIKESIMKRYDPSLTVPVLCPVDARDGIDLQNSQKTRMQKFYVVQKIHTIQALKELEKDGKFTQLISHGNSTVVCFVLRTSSSGVIQYGNIRSNDIQNQFMRDSTAPQDMLTIYKTLREKETPESAIKVVERMSRLSRMGPNEITAIRKLCGWSHASFSALMNVISKFELYQTLDVKPKGHQRRLSEGLKLNMTDVMFKLLGKLDEDFFMERHEKILNCECSLKSCINEYENLKQLQKVAAILTRIAEYESFESLKLHYPKKFDEEILKRYLGAEIKNGIKNNKASDLEKYYRSVICGGDYIAKRRIVEYDDLKDLFSLNNHFEKFETVIFHMKEENKEVCFDFVNSSILAPNKARLILFPDEKEQFEMMTHLRGLGQDKLTIMPLLFSAKPVCNGDINENVQFGILFGEFSVLIPPISRYNNITNLLNIVERITATKSAVAFISDGKSSLVEVHSTALAADVSYFGKKDEILRFKMELQKKHPPEVVEPSGDISVEQTMVITNKEQQETRDSSNLDKNNNSGENNRVIKDVDESTTSPFKTPKLKRSQANIPKTNILERLDSIAEEIDKDRDEYKFCE